MNIQIQFHDSFQGISIFYNIIKIRLAKLKEKELEKVDSAPQLYDALLQRHLNYVKDLDEHLDIMAKFTKDESQAYLQHKNETCGHYEFQMIKYARDAHNRLAHKPKNVRNSQYLTYADRVIKNMVK